MTFFESSSRSIFLFEHDLRANAVRLSRGKTASHFSGSCSRLGRPAVTIVFGEDGTDQPAEALGLLVVQIAGQAERMAAGFDELLQRLGALGGIADDGVA